MLAHVLGRGVDGVLVLRREDLGRNLVGQLLQDFELAAFRQPGRLQIRVAKEALGSGVLLVEQVLVDEFEVEREIERLPHAHILELRAPQVQGETLHGLHALD